MMCEITDPKDKPAGKSGDDPENKKKQPEDLSDDNEEFPDLYNEKDEDFDDPDEQEII